MLLDWRTYQGLSLKKYEHKFNTINGKSKVIKLWHVKCVVCREALIVVDTVHEATLINLTTWMLGQAIFQKRGVLSIM